MYQGPQHRRLPGDDLLRAELQNVLRAFLLACQMAMASEPAIASEASVDASSRITPERNSLWE